MVIDEHQQAKKLEQMRDLSRLGVATDENGQSQNLKNVEKSSRGGMVMDEGQQAKNLEKARNPVNAKKLVGAAALANPTTALTSAIANKESRKIAKKALHVITHWFEYIEWSTDGIILIPLFFAVIKDILDWIGFSLPVLNEALNFSIMGFSACVFAFISASSSKASRVKTGIRSSMKWIVLLAGTTIEEIFGINFLPIESLSIAIAFVLVVWERMLAEPSAEQKKENANEELSYA